MKNRDRFLLGVKVGTLQRVLKKKFGHRWWKRNNNREKKLIKDLKWFPRDLVDYLLELKIDDLDSFIYDINSWIYLESRASGRVLRKYKEGWAKEVFEQHKKQLNTKKN